jgi:hypothetical protein
MMRGSRQPGTANELYSDAHVFGRPWPGFKPFLPFNNNNDNILFLGIHWHTLLDEDAIFYPSSQIHGPDLKLLDRPFR